MRRRAFFGLAAVTSMMIPLLAAREVAARDAQDEAERGWRELVSPDPSPLLEGARRHADRYGRMWEHYEEIMLHHTCTCEHCVPSLGDKLARQGPNHFGMRFFDRGTPHLSDAELMDWYTQTTVNGRPVLSVNEVVVGNPGTVWMFRGVPDRKADSEGLNAGYRHICVTCSVRAIDDRLYNAENVLYRREWSEQSQRMVSVRITPRWGACFTKLTLPNVEATLRPGARELWEADTEQRERRWRS